MSAEVVKIQSVAHVISTGTLNRYWMNLRDFVSQYPAILAAYFIYGYYFISTMDFYISWKTKHFGATEAISHFDTLLWMWVLSWMFVKVIELKEKLHKEQNEVLAHKQALEVREAELRTMNEVVMTLKHQINNPLAIILGYIRLTLKKNTDEEIAKKLSEIEIAAQRINTAMKEFSLIEIYKTTDSPVGPLVQLPSDEKKSPAT